VATKQENKLTLDNYRKDFELATNRSISMPLAGALVWLFVGLVSVKFDFKLSIYLLLFATGAILPIALIIARCRKEALLASTNPLSKLMGLCVLMVNLLWGVHFPLVFLAPEFVPLSLGIGLGLHWVVYSWVIGHPLGIIHAILRTFLVVAAWYFFPESRIFAVSLAVVLAYFISLIQMLTRKI
jgi:hypothetical protein